VKPECDPRHHGEAAADSRREGNPQLRKEKRESGKTALKRSGSTGTRRKAQGTRHKAQSTGTRHKAQGTRHKAQGTRHKAQGTRHKAQDTRHKAQGTRHKAQGTKYQAQGTRAGPERRRKLRYDRAEKGWVQWSRTGGERRRPPPERLQKQRT
jgi:hypothetical protein